MLVIMHTDIADSVCYCRKMKENRGHGSNEKIEMKAACSEGMLLLAT